MKRCVPLLSMAGIITYLWAKVIVTIFEDDLWDVWPSTEDDT